jgi:hypothetical protein
MLLLVACNNKYDLTFAVMGDIHYQITEGHATEKMVLSTANELAEIKPEPAFFLQTGDFFHGSSGAGVEAEAAFAFSHFRETIGMPFFVAKGNHDMRNFYEKNALPIFSIELGSDVSKSYYSFDRANCHFIFLDCTEKDLQEQLSWLEKDLESAKSGKKIEHIFAAGHYPLWVVARAGFTRPEYAGPVASLLAKYKTDAYFCGHTHNKSVTVRIIEGQPLTQIMDAGVVEEGRLFNLAPFLNHIKGKPSDPARPGILPLEEGHQIFIPPSELKYYWGYQEGSTTSYNIVTVTGKNVTVDWHIPGEGVVRSFKWDKPGILTDLESPEKAEGELLPVDAMKQIGSAWLYTAPWTSEDSVAAPFTINGIPAGLIEINRKKMAGSPFWNKTEVPLTGPALAAINMENEIIFTNPSKGRFGFAHIFILIRLKDGSFARSSLSERVITSFRPEKGQYPNFPDPELVASTDTGLPLEKVSLKFDRLYFNEQK